MTVVVYGATGWTGTQVARALQARGVPIALAGRSRDRLERAAQQLGIRTPVRTAALSDPQALRGALTGADWVVNCSGPFVETGPPVLKAALAARVHYMDVSGEESHVREVYDSFDEPARRRGILVCPAFASKGALGDWCASVAATDSMRACGLDEVNVAYAHGLREYFRPSIASVLAAAGQGVIHRGGPTDIPPREFPFPRPFGRGFGICVPYPDDCSIPRHLDVKVVRSFLSLHPGSPINEPWAKLSFASVPILPAISKVLFSKWGRLNMQLFLQKPEPTHEQDSFAVSVVVRAGEEISRLAVVTNDAYASTAEMVALGIQHLLSQESVPHGVLAPSEIASPPEMLGALQDLGVIDLVRPRTETTGPRAARSRQA